MMKKWSIWPIIVSAFSIVLVVVVNSCSNDNPVDGPPPSEFEMSEENIVYSSTLGSANPRAVWTNNGALAVWSEIPAGNAYTDIMLARIDSTGEIIGDALLVAREHTNEARPAIVWTGVSAVVIWHGDARSLKSRSFSAEGGPLGEAAALENTPPFAEGQAMVWTGTNVLYLWSSDNLDEGRRKINIARTDGQGSFIEGFRSIACGDDATVSSASWVNGKLHVIWKGTDVSLNIVESSFFGTTFLADGKAAGPSMPLFEGVSTRYASLACDGSSRYLLCRDEADAVTAPHIRCTVYDNSFNVLNETAITSPQQGQTEEVSNLACTGSSFLISWTDTQVKAAVISRNGNNKSGTLLISEGSGFAKQSHVAATPSGYIIVWSDWRDGSGGNIYARSVLAR